MAASSEPRVKVFIAATLALCALFAALYWPGSDSSPDAARLSRAQALEDASAHVIVNVEGQHFNVDLGAVSTQDGAYVTPEESAEVLRIAHALALAKYDPILSLQGTDLDELESAVDALAAARDELATFEPDEDVRQRIMEELYPVALLRSAASLEKTRREMLLAGTEDAYVRYAQTLDAVLKEGKESVHSFAIAYREAVRTRHYRIVTLGGTLTRDRTLAALTAIEDMYRDATAKAHQRKLCFEGAPDECPVPDADFTAIAGSSAKNEATMRRTLALLDEARGYRGIGRSIITLENSACLSKLPGLDYIEMRTRRDSPFAEYAYVGDIVLRSVADTYDSSVAWFASKGLEHVPYSPLLGYTCPFVASDIARARALYDLSRKLGFEQNSVIYESAVLARLEETYANLPLREKEELRALYLGYEDRSAAFEDAVYNVAHGLRSMIALHKNGSDIAPNESALFAAHSAYLALFLADNRSLGISRPESYEPGGEQAFWARFFLYSQTPDLDRARLVEDIGAFFGAHTL